MHDFRLAHRGQNHTHGLPEGGNRSDCRPLSTYSPLSPPDSIRPTHVPKLSRCSPTFVFHHNQLDYVCGALRCFFVSLLTGTIVFIPRRESWYIGPVHVGGIPRDGMHAETKNKNKNKNKKTAHPPRCRCASIPIPRKK